ncbi:MAG TPA: SCO family protein, partial [Vicinamibacterales bacterium]|nr:SCO family protein [Vicinamibacterales bacterium]
MAPIVACCLVAALWLLASVRVSTDNSRWGANYFPNVTLTTQEGRSVRFYDDLIKGKIVAINLIYTSCQYNCPLETARLAQVQKLLGDRMGKDVFFYSITIDPQHDTPAVLKAYAEQFGAGPGWLFLTGTEADIDLLSRKLGLYSPPKPSNKDGHTPSLLVGNEATGQWTRNVATSQPSSLARMIGTWLNSWQNAAATPIKSYADAPPAAPFDLGAYTYAKRCGACHTIGRGESIAPDLLGVTDRRDRAWLTRFIASPNQMRAAGDSTALALRAKYQVQMPNLSLSDDEVAAVIDYVAKQSRAPAPAATVTVGPMLTAYLAIQRGLAADSLAGVKARAIDVASEATRGGTVQQLVAAAAKAFERVTDLASARAAFGTLSDAMLTAAKRAGRPLDAGVKVA